jgi:hypothetical protein
LSEIAEYLSGRKDARDHVAEGRLVDLNTGIVRRDHVLVQRAAGADLFIGFGALAGRALDFAFEDGDVEGDFGEGQEEVLRASGVEKLAAIEDRPLRRLALLEASLEKAAVDDPVHPGYPAGAADGKGGQFRPKDGSTAAKETTTQKLKRLKALREFRAAIGAAMVLVTTAPLEAAPGIDVAATIRAAVELGRIAIELGNDEREINRAIEFVQKGPYTLDELRVDEDDVSFSSFDAFRKVTPAELIVRRYPMTEFGSEYHHIVEKGGDNAVNFSQEQLQSTRNIIPLPGPLHDLVSAEYSKEYDDSGKTVREWLSGQSFEDQWNEGVKILRSLGIVK